MVTVSEKPENPPVASTPAEGETIDRVRLVLNIDTQVNDFLEQVAREAGTSQADVIRIALGLLKSAKNARKKGLKVGAFTEDEALVTEFVGF